MVRRPRPGRSPPRCQSAGASAIRVSSDSPRRRRGESLETLIALEPADWQRGGEHRARGRLTIDMLVAHLAWHDDNHLEQLTRALEGRP